MTGFSHPTGYRNMNHLLENLGANEVQLTPAELNELDAGFSRITVRGGRTNETQDAGR